MTEIDGKNLGPAIPGPMDVPDDTAALSKPGGVESSAGAEKAGLAGQFQDQIAQTTEAEKQLGLVAGSTGLAEAGQSAIEVPPELAQAFDSARALANVLREGRPSSGAVQQGSEGGVSAGLITPDDMRWKIAQAAIPTGGAESVLGLSSTPDGILAMASSKAQNILNDGLQEATDILNRAEQVATQIEQQGWGDADGIRAMARQQAAQVLEDAQNEIQATVAKITQSWQEKAQLAAPPDTDQGDLVPLPDFSQEIEAEIASARNSILDQANNRSESILSAGQAQADRIIAQSRAAADDVRDSAWEDAFEVRRSSIDGSDLLGRWAMREVGEIHEEVSDVRKVEKEDKSEKLDLDEDESWIQDLKRGTERFGEFTRLLEQGSPVEIRQAAVALLRNPAALDQLNRSGNESLRSAHTETMTGIFRDTDSAVAACLAEKYGCQPADVEIIGDAGRGAGGVAREISGQIRGRDIPAATLQSIYNRELYQAAGAEALGARLSPENLAAGLGQRCIDHLPPEADRLRELGIDLPRR